jgi:pimeloyl-ACP methyl ester carboxylesterase
VPEPEWFAQAVGHEPRRHDLHVDGCRIRLREWGEPDRPGLVLVHGGAAHAGWWDHIAPFFVADHHVVALDLSGHGDSEWRSEYDPETWSREVGAAAAFASASGGPPIVVGHSMGGRVSVMLAARCPDDVGALVLVDSPLAERTHDEELLARRRRPTRVYATADEAAAHWVSLPPQDGTLDYVRDRVAAHSVHEVDGGWTWKFDPTFFGRSSRLGDAPERVRSPFVLLRSEHGILRPNRVAEIRERLGARIRIVQLPASGHHPMLDQPLRLVGALRAVLDLGAGG